MALTIKVYDTAGTAQTVEGNTGAVATYLAAGSATAADIRMVTVADYTIIVNTKVALATATSTDYEITRVHTNFEIMSSWNPTASTYHSTQEDSVGYPVGFWQYTETDNGFAEWDGPEVGKSFSEATGYWNNAQYNPCGFKVTFNDASGGEGFTASGAGTAAVNQTYTENGTNGGKTAYQGDTDDTFWIYWNSNEAINSWELGTEKASQVNPQGVTHYFIYDEGDTPPLTGWSVGNNGAAPAPTFVTSTNTHGYEVVDNFFEKPETTVEGIALRLQRKLQAAGARNALIHWEATDANKGRMVITSPYRGTGASVSNISAPDNAWDLTKLSSVRRPFDFDKGTATAGSGAVTTQSEIIDRWTRVAPPNQPNADLDVTTMPVKMVRTDQGPPDTFTLSQITWGFRPNGDDDTNPPPSLWDDGSAIKDVVFHRNRMILAGDESIVMSRDGDFFEFYLEDYDDITDADPIDIALSSDQITLIEHVVPFRKSLVIFTDAGRQFELNAPDSLTPTSAAITPSTSYQTLSVRPQPLGNTLYFIAQRQDAGQLFEYFYDDSRVSNFAADVTAHAESLLPTSIRTIVTSPNDNAVVVLPGDDNDLYVYKSHWDGNEKAQSAWTKFEFDSGYDIEDIAVIDNECFMLVDAGAEGFVVEKFPLSRQGTTDSGGFAYIVHLDRQFELTGVESGGTTTWTLPDSLTDATIDSIVLGPDFGSNSGAVKTPDTAGATVTLAGDWSDGECKLGRAYTMSVELSQPYVRDFNGLAIPSGRLQVRRVTTIHHNSRDYSIRANMRARSTDRTKTFSVTTTDEDGELTAWRGGNSDDLKLFIENATARPCTISAIEYLVEHSDRRG